MLLFFTCPPTDPSLTLTNLIQLLKDVKDWVSVGADLNIPLSMLDSIKKQHSSKSQCKEACWEWFLNNHPSLEWNKVADALYCNQEHELLEVLKSQYFKGWSHTQCMISGSYFQRQIQEIND